MTAVFFFEPWGAETDNECARSKIMLGMTTDGHNVCVIAPIVMSRVSVAGLGWAAIDVRA